MPLKYFTKSEFFIWRCDVESLFATNDLVDALTSVSDSKNVAKEDYLSIF